MKCTTENDLIVFPEIASGPTHNEINEIIQRKWVNLVELRPFVLE